MRACVAARPANRRSQTKPRLAGSVGIQVRRLRPTARDRHGSTAACGGTDDALSHVVEIATYPWARHRSTLARWQSRCILKTGVTAACVHETPKAIMGGLSKVLSRCYKTACGLLRAVVPWRKLTMRFLIGREGRSFPRFPPPTGLWLLEEESSGAGRWRGRASASR